jgi:hypothetical protein
MPMIAAMTAAEIAAAAEAAAVATAAAEAAAAAQAASAASTAATAATAAPTVAAAAPSAGILGAELGAANALSGAGATQAGIVAEAAPAIEAATAVGGQGAGTAATQAAMESTMQSAAGAPASLAPPAGITAVPEAATTVAPAGEVGMSEAQRAYLEASEASLSPGTNVPVNRFLPAPQTSSLSPEILQAAGNAPVNPAYSLTNPANPVTSTPMQYQLSPPGSSTATQGLKLGSSGTQGLSATSPGASSFGNLPPSQPSMFDKFSAFADKHPFMTGASMFTTAYKTGMLDQKPVDMPEKKKYGNQYTMSKDFQASEATPNVYEPTYRTYAEGGGVMEVGGPSSQVMEPRQVIRPTATMPIEENEIPVPSYAKGGSTLSSSLDFYKQMTEGRKPSTSKGSSAPQMEDDVGIYYDPDPDTRSLDPLTAAQIRQAKVNKRTNMQLPASDVMKRPTAMGKLNLAPPGAKSEDGSGTTEAAQGGIMQAGSSLGGYAAGGNPRLLKGPGDGMSDNIPAVIGRKQPARLADGEFVIPADVVSHLGNGSTEAGAKRLHEMMSKVRKDRTGNSKQGKQINPNKYMPK